MSMFLIVLRNESKILRVTKYFVLLSGLQSYFRLIINMNEQPNYQNSVSVTVSDFELKFPFDFGRYLSFNFPPINRSNISLNSSGENFNFISVPPSPLSLFAQRFAKVMFRKCCFISFIRHIKNYSACLTFSKCSKISLRRHMTYVLE